MLSKSVDKPQYNPYSREKEITKVPNLSDHHHMLDTTMH